MDAGQPDTPPPELRLLWPEMDEPAAGEQIDHESALIAERRAKVFRLFSRGLSVRAIAEHESVRCSKSTVGRDVQHVLASFRLASEQSMRALLARELAVLAGQETEMWDAWERSKGEITETATSRRAGRAEPAAEGGADAALTSASVKKKQRDGNPRFMEVAIACGDRRRRLLGMLSPEDLKGEALPPVKLVAGVDPAELV